MTFLTLAYLSVWILVTGYVVFISRKQNSLEMEMQALEETVDDATSGQTK